MSDLLNLFTRSSGESLYFFILILVSLASLFMIVGQRIRLPENRSAGRYSVALFGVSIAWISLLVASIVTLNSSTESIQIMPPLEQFVTFVAILLLTWAFLSHDNLPENVRPNVLLGIVFLTGVGGYAFTAWRWFDLAGEVDFVLSAYGATWIFVIALFSGLGAIFTILMIRHVLDAPLKLVFYLLLALGLSITLFQVSQGNIIGNYAGEGRLTVLLAFLILPLIIYRMVLSSYEQRLEESHRNANALISQQVNPSPTASPTPVVSPVQRESVQMLRALGLILEDATAKNIPERIVKTVADVLKMDVVALLRVTDANYADVSVLFDSLMGRIATGISINLDKQPTLVNALEWRQYRSMNREKNSQEISDLFIRFDIEESGPVYFFPMVHERELVGVLVACSPYTKRELISAEQELLRGIGVMSAGLLALSDAAGDAERQAEERAIQEILTGVQSGDNDIFSSQQESQKNLSVAREQIAELSKQVMALKVKLDNERARVATSHDDSEESLSASQQMLALNDEYQDLRAERDALAVRLQEAEAALTGATAADEQQALNNLVEMLQREKESLNNERDLLQTQLDELQQDDGVIPQAVMQNLIGQMTEEKDRLERERDNFKSRLVEIQSQLKTFGIEDESNGLSGLIGHLYEQRATLQTQNKALQSELERLMDERARLDQAVQTEEVRALRVQSLEREVQNLAGDREVLNRQLEQARSTFYAMDEKLNQIKVHRAKMMAQAAGYQMELKEAHDEQNKLRERLQKLSDEQSELIRERDRLIAEKQAAETDRDQYLARIEGDRERVEAVGETGVGSLTTMIDELTATRSRLEHDLTEAQHRLAANQNELEALRVRLDDPSIGSGNTQLTNVHYNSEMMISLVQDLRTPMTSITGYVDLLMAESAGILGEMQRTFLQRVSTNVSRLSTMLDDLLQVSKLDAGQVELKPVRVDAVGLIEDALTNASTQFREKDLEISLNLDTEIPQVEVDTDSLNQIFGQLLTNAYLVSPPGTEISVEAQQRALNLSSDATVPAVDCLYVSVKDNGGGIDPEDEARVFARKYKPENPLIQGLGDTGVGMAIAKALVEAHGGRLWLTIEENVGTAFSFAIPISSADVSVEG